MYLKGDISPRFFQKFFCSIPSSVVDLSLTNIGFRSARDSPALTDLLRRCSSLTSLQLRDSLPMNEQALLALRATSSLRELTVSITDWSPNEEVSFHWLFFSKNKIILTIIFVFLKQFTVIQTL